MFRRRKLILAFSVPLLMVGGGIYAVSLRAAYPFLALLGGMSALIGILSANALFALVLVNYLTASKEELTERET